MFTIFSRMHESTASASQAPLLRGGQPAAAKCPNCGGLGVKDAAACTTCDGSGLKAKPARESSDDLQARVEALEETLALNTTERDVLREAATNPVGLSKTMAAFKKATTSKGETGYRVTLIREGPGNDGDDHYYTGPAIREMCESGVCEGMRAYENHPPLDQELTLPERDVTKIIGHYHDVRFAESGGRPRAEAILVPIKGPGYEWVTTLAEAAAAHRGEEPLVGISLYGAVAGREGQRPNGTFGSMVELIRPSSGDMVTTAGAGGEFVRQLIESARVVRRTTEEEMKPMTRKEFEAKMRESTKALREAKTDEERTKATDELDALAGQEITPEPVELTVDGLRESQPALVEKIREAAIADAKTKAAEETATGDEKVTLLEGKLRESESALEAEKKKNADTTMVINAIGVLREAKVSQDDTDFFIRKFREAGARTTDEMKALVTEEQDREKRVEARIRESIGLPGVEGNPGRMPGGSVDMAAGLAEDGIPMVEEPAAA